MSHERTVEHVTRLAHNETQQILGFGGSSEIRAVACSIFEAIRDEDLTDDIPIGVLRDSQANFELALMDVELNRPGSTQKKS